MESSRSYVCASVTYDGTDFHGFQYQVGVPTIQAALEDALDHFAERSSRVVGSGRTDAGVHANGQIVAVTVGWKHSLVDLQRAWNAHLPTSIAVRKVRSVPEDFHPRFSAVSRTYRYVVWQYDSDDGPATPHRSPLTDRFSLFVARRLDLKAMGRAARCLLGRHDFATFGQPPQGESTWRTVHQAEWAVVDTWMGGCYPGRKLTFTVTADAFLQRMVRSLVGCLVAVGQGKWGVDDFQQALECADRSRCLAPAPPQGLVLEKVAYPDELDVLVHGRQVGVEEKLA